MSLLFSLPTIAEGPSNLGTTGPEVDAKNLCARLRPSCGDFGHQSSFFNPRPRPSVVAVAGPAIYRERAAPRGVSPHDNAEGYIGPGRSPVPMKRPFKPRARRENVNVRPIRGKSGNLLQFSLDSLQSAEPPSLVKFRAILKKLNCVYFDYS